MWPRSLMTTQGGAYSWRIILSRAWLSIGGWTGVPGVGASASGAPRRPGQGQLGRPGHRVALAMFDSPFAPVRERSADLVLERIVGKLPKL
jgi:hypothetical protein